MANLRITRDTTVSISLSNPRNRRSTMSVPAFNPNVTRPTNTITLVQPRHNHIADGLTNCVTALDPGRPGMMTKDQSNSLADQLRALHPHSERGAAEPSEARKYVRDHFDVIAAARERQSPGLRSRKCLSITG